MKNLLLISLVIFSNVAIAGVPRGATEFDLKRVIDGDTVVASDETRIRLWGIDTPERNQPHGKSSTKALESLLEGKRLYLEIKDVDRYGRTIGVIHIDDGDSINLLMVCYGQAWWYERYAKQASDYRSCQEAAQTKRLGLWQKDNPTAPWNWRRK